MAIDPSIDPSPPLRAELNAALVVIEGQVTGLRSFAKFEAVPEVLQAIQAQVATRSNRMAYIMDVISALDNVMRAGALLVANGYPALPEAQVSSDILHEIQIQQEQIAIAASIFESSAVALGLDIANATFKDQPTP